MGYWRDVATTLRSTRFFGNPGAIPPCTTEKRFHHVTEQLFPSYVPSPQFCPYVVRRQEVPVPVGALRGGYAILNLPLSPMGSGTDPI